MTNYAQKFPKLLMLASGLGMGLLVGIGMMIGATSAVHQQQNSNSTQPRLPEGIPLEATASSNGENISVATGAIDENVEGVFVLDHLTGQLTCFVANPRNLGGVLNGQFKTNVANDLGVAQGKKPDYVMTVGGVAAIRGGGAARPADSIVYVADGSTGHVVGYSLPWMPTKAKAGQPQGGALVKIMIGQARPNIAQE